MDLNIGRMPHGPRNSIADVSGVRVGHCTVDDERHKTGVTVILPCEDDIFRNKMPAAYHVLNGFGKTTGLMQIGELGTLETPIALTNTLNVGLVHDAMVEYMKKPMNGKLRKYMINYVDIMMTVSSVLLLKSGTEENLEKKKELWEYLKNASPKLYRKIKLGILGRTMNLPGRSGRKISVAAYKVAQKVIGFN